METFRDAKILVVDDEKDTTELLQYQLEEAGYRVVCLNNPLKVLATMREVDPDMILLDVMMPELTGLQVCHMIKADQNLRRKPVIFLTARGEPEDRIRGLEAGVDDYVGKPFDTRELLLRVQAVLKRAFEARKGDGRQLEVAGIVADKDSHCVLVDGEQVLLTLTEFKLLQTLMENFNQVQSREALLSRVWNYESNTETRTVDTHIRRLREKLGPLAERVETVRGVGYRLVEKVLS